MGELLSVTKSYRGLPASHRQPNHRGHCRLIHGHNWGFDITFVCNRLDECGFVVDVGELDFVKKFLQQTFDHTFLVSQDDPYLECFQSRLENDLGAAKIVVVPDCSMEGLAKYVYWQVMNLLPEKDRFGRGLAISAVTCWEDEKNSCTFTPTFETPQ